MTLPLAGLRVADFSWVVAGPYATMFLATMGAEVIRIESSVHTDINRRLPPFADGALNGSVERSGLWHGLNLSKRSCTLDLRSERGQDLALEIIRRSDVVVENFAYGLMDRFHLGWERLRQAGLGRTGPHRAYVTFGPPLTALTGLASITGQLGGPPERWIGGVWSDHTSGLTSLFHLLAALEHRDRTGEGQLLEYSMAETVMQNLPEAYIDYTANGRVWGPQGNRDRVACPHGFFPGHGDDRWIAIAVDSDAAWRALCRAMGRTDWAADPSLATADARRAREGEIEQEIAAWTAAQDILALSDRLQAAGVAAAPAQNAVDTFADPHLRARGFFVAPDHPEVGRHDLSGLPWKISGVEPRIAHAPLLGEDNVYVFTELLGLSFEEFAALVGQGVIV